jgi:hypothetical protein
MLELFVRTRKKPDANRNEGKREEEGEEAWELPAVGGSPLHVVSAGASRNASPSTKMSVHVAARRQAVRRGVRPSMREGAITKTLVAASSGDARSASESAQTAMSARSLQGKPVVLFACVRAGGRARSDHWEGKWRTSGRDDGRTEGTGRPRANGAGYGRPKQPAASERCTGQNFGVNSV